MGENGGVIEIAEPGQPRRFVKPKLSEIHTPDSVIHIAKEKAATELKDRGVYASVNEAIGVDSSFFETDRWVSMKDKVGDGVFLKGWDKALVSTSGVSSEGEQPKFTHYFEKELEDGRKAVVLTTLRGYDTAVDGNTKVPVFAVSKLLFKGKNEACVNFLERLPEGVNVCLRPGDVVLPDGAIQVSTSSYYFSWSKNEISFGGIDSILDAASLWHEGGHAVDWNTADEADKEAKPIATRTRKLALEALVNSDFNGVRKVEEETGMDLPLACFIVSGNERFASTWGSYDMGMVRDILGIDRRTADRICKQNELHWQTYDSFSLPDTMISGFGRGLSEEKRQSLRDFQANHLGIIQMGVEYGIEKDGKFEIKIPDVGGYSFNYEGGVISVFFTPDDPKKPYFNGMISTNGVRISSYENRDAFINGQEKNSDFKLTSAKDFLDSYKNVSKALKFEKDILDVLTRGLIDKEEGARDRIEWAYNALRSYIPDIETFDPVHIALAAIDKQPRVVSSSGLISDSEMDVATHPLKREQAFYRNIHKKIGRDTGIDTENYNFDLRTKTRLNSEWDRLVSICDRVLGKARVSGDPDLSPYEVPNRYLDVEKERKQTFYKAIPVAGGDRRFIYSPLPDGYKVPPGETVYRPLAVKQGPESPTKKYIYLPVTSSFSPPEGIAPLSPPDAKRTELPVIEQERKIVEKAIAYLSKKRVLK